MFLELAYNGQTYIDLFLLYKIFIMNFSWFYYNNGKMMVIYFGPISKIYLRKIRSLIDFLPQINYDNSTLLVSLKPRYIYNYHLFYY